jgi:hypothetical protein
MQTEGMDARGRFVFNRAYDPWHRTKQNETKEESIVSIRRVHLCSSSPET